MKAALAGVLLFGQVFAADAPSAVRDDTGQVVNVAPGKCRIVSLAPGTTAMLFAAGAGHCMVGTIAHSDEPAQAAALPQVGDVEALDLEQLLSLRPTAVVVAIDVVQSARISRLEALGIPIYRVHVTSLAGMPDSLERVGSLTGTKAEAIRAAARLRAELDALAARYRARPVVRVLYQLWDRPIYTIGGRHVISDALRICGARNVFDDLTGIAAPAVTREAVVLRDPELILASGPRASADQWLDEWRRFPALSAVRNGQLRAFSDPRMDRMGPSVIAATADLCALIDSARLDR